MTEEKKEKEYTVVSGTFYDHRTPYDVIEILEAARKTGSRVRLFFGDTETGRDWLEEYDVTGTVSRSMGPHKIPILISNRRSTGGGAILDHCILRILVNGVEKYRNPNYQEPDFVIIPTPESNAITMAEHRKYSKLPYTVKVNGLGHAAFKSKDAADRWVDFMRGKRGCK